MKNKKVLIITHLFRDEIKCGADSRFYNLLKYMMGKFDVTWLSTPKENNNNDFIYFFKNNKKLKVLNYELKHRVPKNNIFLKIRNRLLCFYFSYFGKYNYKEHLLIKYLIKYLRTKLDINYYDIIFLYYLAQDDIINYLNSIKKNYKIVIDTNDIQFERLRKLYNLESKMYLFKRSIFLKRYERSEKKALKGADCLITISKEDKHYLAQKLNCKSVHYCPTATKIPNDVIFNKNIENNIIFFGAMNSISNAKAASYFKKEIFPIIKKEVLNAKYLIVGSNPLPEVLNLDDDNTKVVGYIENIYDYFKNAKCFVCPFQVSYGHRGRIYEVMAAGLPCVVSSLAVKGMELENVEGVIIDDDSELFANHVINILKNDEYRLKLSKSVRNWVINNVSADNIYSKLCDFVNSI